MEVKSKPVFFATPAKWRAWLEKNHESVQELWVGFYKRDSGRPSITWLESVDEALCFGWIDGLRKKLDEDSYVIRFTPRKTTSKWSNINLKRVKELTKIGRAPAGVKIHAARGEKKTYLYEKRSSLKLPPDFEKKFRAKKKAWEFFEAQAPWYRRITTYWIVSAKRDETKVKRMDELLSCSAKGERIPAARPGKK